MKRLHISLLPAVLLFGVFVLGISSQVQAEFQVQFKLGGTGGTIITGLKDNENDVNGVDSDSTVGKIVQTFAIKDITNTTQYTVTVTAETSPFLGTLANPMMDLSFSVTQVASNPLSLTILDNLVGFTKSPANLALSISSSAGAATVDYVAAYDTGNGIFQLQNPSSHLTTLPSSASLSVQSGLTAYSLTQAVTISGIGSGNTFKGDATLGFVPAPESPSFVVWSVLLSLAGCTVFFRRAGL